jgi:hypothetical protein
MVRLRRQGSGLDRRVSGLGHAEDGEVSADEEPADRTSDVALKCHASMVLHRAATLTHDVLA